MKESGQFWNNQLDHMIEVTAKACMAGIEPIHSWMGELPTWLSGVKTGNLTYPNTNTPTDWSFA